MVINPLLWVSEGGPISWLIVGVWGAACAWTLRAAQMHYKRWLDVSLAWTSGLLALGLLAGQLGLILTFTAVAKEPAATKQAMMARGMEVSGYPLALAILAVCLFGIGCLLAWFRSRTHAPPAQKAFGWVVVGSVTHLGAMATMFLASATFVGAALGVSSQVLAPSTLVETLYTSVLTPLAVLAFTGMYGLARLGGSLWAWRRARRMSAPDSAS